LVFSSLCLFFKKMVEQNNKPEKADLGGLSAKL
jgi:hypothetical protein